MTPAHCHAAPASAGSIPAGAVAALGVGDPSRALRRAVGVLARWRRLARERRALAALDPRLLRDIGLDPATAAREAARPFWDGGPRD